MRSSTVTATLVWLCAFLFAQGCSEIEKESENMLAIEICLDQGGEWDGAGCVYAYCIQRRMCKQGSEICPCDRWVYERA